jgi:hypothetical protein
LVFTALRLPKAHLAIVDQDKLVQYLLNSEHPDGRPKARFFAALGYWAGDPEPLRQALIDLAQRTDMEEVPFQYGVKYVGTGDIEGQGGRKARLTTVWLTEPGEPSPRLITAYPAH